MSLSPKTKRAGIVGGVSAVALLAAWLMIGPNDQPIFTSEKTPLDGVLFTGDTRPKSLEAVAAKIDSFEKRLVELADENRKLQEARRRDLQSVVDRLTDELNSRDAARRAEAQEQLKSLRDEMARLDIDAPDVDPLDHGETDRPADDEPALLDLPAPPVSAAAPAPASSPASLTPPPAAVDAADDAPFSSSRRAVDPVEPAPVRLTDRETRALFASLSADPFAFDSAARPASMSGAAPAAGASSGGEIRRILSAEPAAASDPAIGGRSVYLPPGSIINGVLLTGLDAPGGSSAQANPVPVLLRVKHQAILPNNFSADVSECFLLLSSYGDLSSERALMRGEDISCLLRDGTVMSRKIKAYVAGEDGKAGVRGRLVTRQGAYISRAILVGMIDGLAQALNDSTRISVGAGSGSGGGPSEAIISGFGAGFSSALDRVADWYLEQASALFPIIEIDNGREIDVVLTEGLQFRIDL